MVGRRFAPLLLAAAAALLMAAGCGDGAAPTLGLARAHRVSADAPPPSGLQEVLRLDHRLAQAVVRRGDEHVGFDEPSDRALLGPGWGELETDAALGRGFAWVTGTRAELATRVIRQPGVELAFTCRAFDYPGAPPQRVQVSLGDAVLGEVTFGPDLATHRLPVPEELLGSGRRLRFDFAWAARPADTVPGSSDTRRLAAAFYALDLAVPDAVAAPGPEAREDGFVQAAGTEVAFPLLVPPGGTLELGAAAAGTAASGRGKAEVWIRHPERGEQRVAAAALDRLPRKRWRIALAPLAGERVEVVLRLVGAGPQDAVLWRRPTVFAEAGRVDARTNLVLVVVDTLRADHLSCYGGTTRTPAMDALAASGVRFARAYSHIPITLPSHSTMFTSELPAEHGVHNNGDVLPSRALTLAEVLRENYRATAGFVSLGVLSSAYGIAQGFDTYGDSFGADWWKTAGEINDEVFHWLDTRPAEPFFLWVHYSDPHEPYAPPGEAYPEVRVTLGGRPAGSFHADGHMVVLDLELRPGANRLDLLPVGRRRERPLAFRYPTVEPAEVRLEAGAGWSTGTVNPRNPALLARPPVSVTLHNPGDGPVHAELRFVCQEKQTRAEKRAAYAREVEYADRQLGRLMDRLRGDGLLDHTLVVLTADHGEGLGDHVQMAHVDQLYEAQVHVPLIFSFPGVLPAGTVVPDVVSHLDLLPTVDRLLRLDDLGARRGRDLTPLMLGEGHEEAPPVVLATYRPEAAVDRRGLVVGAEKYILSPAAGREELYDLDRDPGEHHDLSGERRQRTEGLKRELEALIGAAESARGTPAPGRTLTDEERQRLKTLGYL